MNIALVNHGEGYDQRDNVREESDHANDVGYEGTHIVRVSRD